MPRFTVEWAMINESFDRRGDRLLQYTTCMKMYATMRNLAIFCLVLGCLVFVPRETWSAGKSSAGEKVVARVNGTPITAKEVDDAVYQVLPRSIHGNIAEEKKDEYRGKALDVLIAGELLYQEAVKRGFKVAKADVAAEVKKVRDRFKSDADFGEALAKENFTLDSYEKAIEKNMVKIKFVQSEIIDKTRVTDERLKDYYESHKSEFLRPEAVKLKMISIKVDPAAAREEWEKAKKKTEELREKAAAGADFSDLAEKYSMDDWRVKAGDVGVVHRGRFVPELEAAAFGLKEGEISGVVESIYGYHILKLEKKIPPVQLSFAEIKVMLKRQLEDKGRKERMDALLKELKGDAKIEMY